MPSERKQKISREWNRRNPERVREAQRRWYERYRQARQKLSRYERAQQDITKLLRPLSDQDRKNLLIWAADEFLDLELDD